MPAKPIPVALALKAAKFCGIIAGTLLRKK